MNITLIITKGRYAAIDSDHIRVINSSILDSNVMSTSLIIMKGRYGDIDPDHFLHLHITFKQT